MSSHETRPCVPDLKKERLKCDFNVEELTNLIDGGKEKTALRRKLRSVISSESAYIDPIPPEYMSHEDQFSNELRKTCHTAMLMNKQNIDIKTLQLSKAYIGVLKDGDPLWVHYHVFIPSITGQSDPEQQKIWMEKIRTWKIFGTYAQTELGHGTFLRGLETTATYDRETREFILNSPTITATKWWPGGLGHTVNFAAVMAQLYVGGKCYGPHMFMVQLRDENTHESLPGVTLGEIGPRFGLNTNGNGFLRFDHYRIPRRNMLMKHAQVLEDGTYVKPSHSKLSYGTMVRVRVGIVRDTCIQLQQAVTIATRYSAVRHQSELIPGEPEPQILDYQTQQFKILPQISSVFALFFAANSVIDAYYSVTAQMDLGDMSLLPELHALSSGLKALSASDASRGVEICRLSCGGHGYLASSNFPRLYTQTTCAITYEGENTVLWLQVARYIIKSYRSAQNGNNLKHSVSYLSKQPRPVRGDLSNNGLLEAFKAAVFKLVSDTEGRIQRVCAKGQNYHMAWNQCSLQLLKCAEAHTRFYVCEQFVRKVEMAKGTENVKKILKNLCRLYLTHHVSVNSGDFLKSGSLSQNDIAVLEEEMCSLLEVLRPQAVSIVDAFDFDDGQLNSCLGCWDGDVYQRLYDEALKSPLNKTDVPEAYYKYLRPLMQVGLKSSL
ncbi:Acyl-coenzyme A oxidase (Acyl-CoA oxidase) [Halocaridina rubra]|uniref:Acyl-coenzyme A oxidase n=1 Tax=Halocaridina rubra TaxID=373956 RepID=A0AAN8XLT7_HALRR